MYTYIYIWYEWYDWYSQRVPFCWKLNAWDEKFFRIKVSGNMEGAGASSFMLSPWPKVGVFIHTGWWSSIDGDWLSTFFRFSVFSRGILEFLGAFIPVPTGAGFFPTNLVPIGAKSSARRPEMNHHNGAQSWKLSESLSWNVETWN